MKYRYLHCPYCEMDYIDVHRLYCGLCGAELEERNTHDDDSEE